MFGSPYMYERLLTINLYVSLQVKNLIERCMQLYMSPKEIVKTLLEKENIEPEFTEISNTIFFLLFLLLFF